MTWQPEIWHTVSFDEYPHCVKNFSFLRPAVLELFAKSENLDSSGRKTAE